MHRSIHYSPMQLGGSPQPCMAEFSPRTGRRSPCMHAPPSFRSHAPLPPPSCMQACELASPWRAAPYLRPCASPCIRRPPPSLPHPEHRCKRIPRRGRPHASGQQRPQEARKSAAGAPGWGGRGVPAWCVYRDDASMPAIPGSLTRRTPFWPHVPLHLTLIQLPLLFGLSVHPPPTLLTPFLPPHQIVLPVSGISCLVYAFTHPDTDPLIPTRMPPQLQVHIGGGGSSVAAGGGGDLGHSVTTRMHASATTAGGIGRVQGGGAGGARGWSR